MKPMKFIIYLLMIPILLFFIQSGMISYMLTSGSIRPEDQTFYGTAPSYTGSIIATILSFIMLAFLVCVNKKIEKLGNNAES